MHPSVAEPPRNLAPTAPEVFPRIKRTPYIFITALVVSVIATLALLSAWQERVLSAERSLATTQNLAHLLDRNISGSFDKIDVVLRNVVLQYEAALRTGKVNEAALNDFLAKQESLIPEALSLRIANPKGIVSFGSGLSKTDSISISDRKYFIRQRDDSTAGLAVSEPLFSRINKQWAIALSRRLNTADGSFAGIVYVVFATDTFEKVMSSLSLGDGGAASIRMADLALVHRKPTPEKTIGSKNVSNELLAALASNPEEGHYVATTALDGIERSNTYRRLRDYPILVIVGVATEKHMQAWRANTLLLFSLAAIAIAITVFAAVFMYRLAQEQADELHKRRLAEANAKETTGRLESALYWSNTGTWDLNLADQTVLSSEKHDQILGYDKHLANWSYAKLLEHVEPEDRPLVEQCYGEAVSTRRDSMLECRIRLPNGNQRWILIAGGIKQDGTDNSQQMTGIIRDITSRKNFEKAEEIRLQFFESLAHGAELAQSLGLVADYAEHHYSGMRCNIILVDPVNGSKTPIVTRFQSSSIDQAGAPAPASLIEPIHGSTGAPLGYLMLYRHIVCEQTDAGQEKIHQASHLAAVAIERTRMEAALAASEREFHTLADNLPDCIVRYDTECRRTYINPAMLKLLCSDNEQLIGKKPSESAIKYIQPVSELERRLQQVLISGQPDSMEISVTVENSKLTYNIAFVAERGEQGQIVGALAIARDISELKEKNRQIQESLETLRTLAARRSSAREEERKHIAREIHDELGQMLTALRLDLATMKFLFGKDNPVLGERCLHLIGITDQTIQVVRKIATALRPAVLDMGISAALGWLIAEFRDRTGLTCHLYQDVEDIPIKESQSLAIFRIVQESLTNIARHAYANQVKVALETCGDRFHLSINDDGNGFDPDSVRNKSFGLSGIRERALLIGGDAHFISAPGHGTAIEIGFPIHYDDEITS